MQKAARGFTLIELIVVIGIISILSSIVLSSVIVVRGKARDAHRYGDIQAMVTALQVMYSAEGHYVCSGWQTSTDSTFMHYLVDHQYLSSIPRDPTNDPSGGYWPYFYVSASAFPGGPCGQYFQLEYDTQVATHQPGEQCAISGGDGQWQSSSHCHFDYPTALPCSDPYLSQYPIPDDCAAILNSGF